MAPGMPTKRPTESSVSIRLGHSSHSSPPLTNLARRQTFRHALSMPSHHHQHGTDITTSSPFGL
ncbi:hypothetical protein K504DRAFT_466454 [Pleomassaria siparia CBS 279.74]|uniref:Uncharacterized protein n=1 Tax=Pleomassaria siparia CBS 279.74 TaxID=1314801 RepID=A0A6G1KC44_9PLEO|nr:hypothetical protein K504DRAFT_466454 [Pleomassaria siparia CBS 279.74]